MSDGLMTEQSCSSWYGEFENHPSYHKEYLGKIYCDYCGKEIDIEN